MKIKSINNFIKYNYKRIDYYNMLEILKSTNDVIILKGLRRIGKTVLLEQICYFNNYKFLFIEIESKDNIQSLYKFLMENYKNYELIIIDEITNIKDIIYDLMFLKDIIVNSGVKVIISGSQSLSLSYIEEHGLFGRNYTYNIYPCNYIDYSNITNKSFISYEESGGFFYDSFNKMTIMNNIVEDIFLSIIKNNVDEDLFNINKNDIMSSIIYVLFLVSWETLNDLLTFENEMDIETKYIYNFINKDKYKIMNYLDIKYNIRYNNRYVSIINEYLIRMNIINISKSIFNKGYSRIQVIPFNIQKIIVNDLMTILKDNKIFRNNKLKGKYFQNILNSQLIINNYRTKNINFNNFEVDCCLEHNNNLYLLEYKSLSNKNKIKIGLNRQNLINVLKELNTYENIYHIIIWEGNTEKYLLNYIDFLKIINDKEIYRLNNFNTNFEYINNLSHNQVDMNWI